MSILQKLKLHYHRVVLRGKNWYNVRKGKANILIALNSNTLKSYEVEIIGLNYINKNRNIKIK